MKVKTVTGRFFAIIAAALVASIFVTACNSSSSSASTSPTLSQLATEVANLTTRVSGDEATMASQAATITSLKGEVATLKAKIATVTQLRLTIGNGSSASAPVMNRTYATSATTIAGSADCAWMNNGYSTVTGVMDINTCTGYVFGLTASTAGQTSHITQLSAGATIGFDQSGCAGNAYLEPNGSFADSSVALGVVFVMDPTTAGTPDYTNPANYWYTPSGEGETSYTELSQYIVGTGCQASNLPTAGYPVLAQPAATNGRAINLVTGGVSQVLNGPQLPTKP